MSQSLQLLASHFNSTYLADQITQLERQVEEMERR